MQQPAEKPPLHSRVCVCNIVCICVCCAVCCVGDIVCVVFMCTVSIDSLHKLDIA